MLLRFFFFLFLLVNMEVVKGNKCANYTPLFIFAYKFDSEKISMFNNIRFYFIIIIMKK